MMSAWDNQKQSTILGYGNLSGDPLTSTDVWFFSGGSWSFLSSVQLAAPEPSERLFASVANDPWDMSSFEQKKPVVGSVLQFGGATSIGMDNQTWLYEHQYWTELFPPVTPSARDSAALVNDTKDGYMLLFGGRSQSGAALGDTWKFSNGNWTNITSMAGTPPSPRFGAGIVYDWSLGSVVLFGGTDGSRVYGDTWTFAGGQWSNATASSSPPARAYPGFAFNYKTGNATLFGGLSASAVLNDTWKLTGTVWKVSKTNTTPPLTWDPGLVFNAKSRQMVMFGGCSEFIPLASLTSFAPCNAVQNLTWKFAGNNWIHVAPISGSPAGRFAQAAAYDGADGNYFLWGGSSGDSTLIDRWGLAGAHWLLWTPQIAPTPREGTSASYSATLVDQFYFGGYGITPSGTLGFLNQTWLYHTGEWREAFPRISPSARAFAAQGTINEATFNGTGKPRQDVILFGGWNGSSYLGDTWVWQGGSLTGTWTQASTSASPSPRAYTPLWPRCTRTYPTTRPSSYCSGGGTRRPTSATLGSGREGPGPKWPPPPTRPPAHRPRWCTTPSITTWSSLAA